MPLVGTTELLVFLQLMQNEGLNHEYDKEIESSLDGFLCTLLLQSSGKSASVEMVERPLD